MRELSLHILDLIENGIRAGATVISVTIREQQVQDVMEVTVEDNGCGLKVPAGVATDPFFTTKEGKRTGLGLSLFRGSAERAGGSLRLRNSRLGGLCVRVRMRLSHIDRSPLGDIAGTLSSIACSNPDLDLRYRIHVGRRIFSGRSKKFAEQIPAGKRNAIAVSQILYKKIQEGLTALNVIQ
ncbi:MAG TPA: ATP-binding protein [Spirochaetia bacterium]|nr:ATP-binding protein [Spirochaetia bacterium]